jgi:selenocysteine lyase/cysteine desulfurase
MEHWDRYVVARAEAAGWLLAIAVEHGTGSPLHRQAELVWIRAAREALASLEHADPANAVSILEHALHALSRAPEILKRRELSQEDLIGLMGA